MSVSRIKKLSRGTQVKIIAAFILGCAAILLSVSVTRNSFGKILGTVNELSHPDPQIQLVNNILRHVIVLDQTQRELVFNPGTTLSKKVISESDTLQKLLTRLEQVNANNSKRLRQVDSMKRLLRLKNGLFIDYMMLRTDLVKNDTMLRQIQSLSEHIYNPQYNKDTNVVTMERKVTTTTVASDTSERAEERESFWNRLFGKKKPVQPKKVQTMVQEELNIKIDTLAMVAKDSTVERISEAIRDEVIIRISKRNKLIERQLDMIDAGNQLVNRLLTILRQIEREETIRQDEKNKAAADVIGADMEKLDKLMILFIIGSALLGYRIFVDIVRGNRYRKELQQAKDAAEEANIAKQRFLSNISHELRTPLQTIVGVSEQMNMRATAKPEEIGVLYHSSQHLLQIVNEVLDYSQIISGKFTFDHKPFNMSVLLKEVYDVVTILANRKQLELAFISELDASGTYIGDAFRLKQVLFNLIGNAIKYTQTGNVTLTVSENRRRASSTFIFSVKDTGIGISEGDIDRIFEQFERARNNDTQGQGTGLGLNIVQALVDGQKGTVQVFSEEGMGSEFVVTLTYAHAKANQIIAADDISTSAISNNGPVLIVDDDPFILQLCSGIMSKYHIEHRIFSSPAEVLQEEVDDISVVLLDIRLPEMSGIELMKKLRVKMSRKHVRFIALTAEALPDERAEILEQGFDELLMKPFMEKDIISIINSSPIHEPTTIPIEDISVLNAMTGGDLDINISILNTFLAETRKDMEAYEHCCAKNNYSAASEYLHKLSGRLGQIGATSLGLEARKLERAYRNDDVNIEMQTASKVLMQDIRILMSNIEDFTD